MLVASCAADHAPYGYSDSSYETVELVPERRPQPAFAKADIPVYALRDYLAEQGVECPNFGEAFNFGSDNFMQGDCRRSLYALYVLEVFTSAAEKRSSIDGSVAGCDDVGRHEYWIEGPDWAVSVYDHDQQTKAKNEASTKELALAMAQATGARLYRAC
ncbi:MAG: hypothetical protein U0W40_05465 [Acidimicrobiia bacterium]